MHQAIVVTIYSAALPLWLLVWWAVDGYALFRRAPLLWLPFGFGVFYLLANLLMVLVFGADTGSSAYEESRFHFIGERAMIAVQATASVLIVATLVYGLTIRKVPVDFIRFMVYSFVALLGLMAPIIWIPEGSATGLFTLRHFQTVALTFGLFLCVGGIVILLRDLLAHGDARISFEEPSGFATGSPASDPELARRDD
ncbi:hypothetical protein [Aquisalimonas asiatica]|uniref:Uncharacterized protein n=1 Tax=Aquisalimonas asiatica TaxID=406100 RepID=A0A1H8SNV8_9GAMM|nr:hypothetical protein [Aquisalimonas asiatica]SEO80255.1 hypothetical protein SAMN04488052_10396 [Aquisalimonas asiatica]